MIWSTAKQAEFIDVAIDALCTGTNPHCALSVAAVKLGYSTLTVNEMISLEKFANDGTIFEGNSGDVEKRIARLQKLRNYIHKDPYD